MTSTKAQKANGNGITTSIVIPQGIAECLNVNYGDKISWTLENRGDAESPYLVAVICNQSNQETSQRKLQTCIKHLENAFDDLKASYDTETEYSSALKKGYDNLKQYVEGLERELEHIKTEGDRKEAC